MTVIIAGLMLLAGGALTVYTAWQARQAPAAVQTHGVPPGRATLYMVGGIAICAASIALIYLGGRYNW